MNIFSTGSLHMARMHSISFYIYIFLRNRFGTHYQRMCACCDGIMNKNLTLLGGPRFGPIAHDNERCDDKDTVQTNLREA